MPTARNPRNYKRVSQACSNCRRKKTRCPGEKPVCSHCIRLSQNCWYPDGQFSREGVNKSSKSQLEARVAQLERKFELRVERACNFRRGGESIASTATSRCTSPANIQPTSSGLPLPGSIVIPAVHAFFKYVHRQPLWLFDRDDTLNPASREELLLATLSIVAQRPYSDCNLEQMLSPEVYGDAARRLIMSRIASGSVDLPLLQALCLLTYSNLLLNDAMLAGFHTMMLKALLRSSGLAFHSSQENSPRSEEEKRLVWSIFLLEYVCGQQQETPSLIHDLHNPYYLRMEATDQHASVSCPSLPCESYTDGEEKSIGIWAHMVGMISIWNEVKLYVFRCAEGAKSTPWKPDSAYTRINSHIFDLELRFPDFYRYDSAGFMERSVEEMSAKRDYWLPWLRVQINFHAIHSILNHPFLLASTRPTRNSETTGFWKSSSQLALLHSTWISRLLEMVKARNLQLSDPLFTYAGAIAATLHAYWSYAPDTTVRTSARKNLDVCRAFVSGWGPQWPICQSMGVSLDDFLDLMLPTKSKDRDAQELDRSRAAAMWKIVLSIAPRPQSIGPGLFVPSLVQERDASIGTSNVGLTIDELDFGTTPINIHDTVSQYAAPPDRFFSASSTLHGDQEFARTAREDLEDQPVPQQGSLGHDDDSTFHSSDSLMTWAWPPDNMLSTQTANMFDQHGGTNLDWWDNGIL